MRLSHAARAARPWRSPRHSRWQPRARERRLRTPAPREAAKHARSTAGIAKRHPSPLTPATTRARSDPSRSRAHAASRATTARPDQPTSSPLGGYLLLNGRGLAPGLIVAFPRSTKARISSSSPSRTSSGEARHRGARAARGTQRAHRRRHGAAGHSNAFGPIQIVNHALHPPAPKPTPPANSTPAAATAFADRGCGSGTSATPTAATSRRSPRRRTRPASAPVYVKSSDGSHELLEPVHAAARRRAPRAGAQGVRVAVRLWQLSRRRGGTRRARGRRRRRLPRDRRGGGVRRPLRRRPALHRNAAREDRRELPRSGSRRSPTSTTTSPSPTPSSSAPAARSSTSRRCTGRRSARASPTSTCTPTRRTSSTGATICPLGQTYENPPAQQIVSFRSLAAPYGACGTSCWDWQETTSSGWAALAAPLTPA